jgi:urease accessory protein
VAGRSVVVAAQAHSPLRILTPRGAADSAWVFTSTFGGGLVAGDEIELECEVGRGATCLISTQSQTKVYRSADAQVARQGLAARIHPDAMLLSLPDPVTCFADSIFEQRQHIEMSDSSSLLWLDWLTSGRRARGERWAFRRYAARTDIVVNGSLVFRDAMVLDNSAGPIADETRMGSCDCFASFLLLGPRLAEAASSLLAWTSAQPATGREPILFSASPVSSGVVVRAAGPTTESVARWLRDRLSFLPKLLGGNPWARKW